MGLRKGEYAIYSDTLGLLEKNGCKILCASPPGGTSGKYRKCLLPKKKAHRNNLEKGHRDEIDIIAVYESFLLLIECKPSSSLSLSLSNDEHENDEQKLIRIIENFSCSELEDLLYKYCSPTGSATENVIGLLSVSTDNAEDSRLPVLEVTGAQFVFRFPQIKSPGLEDFEQNISSWD